MYCITAYICGQASADKGQICGPQVTRWYFDSTTKTCSTFIYYGCGGSPNNFPNRELCESYCDVGGCPYGGQVYKIPSGAVAVCDGLQASPCPAGFECLDVTLGMATQARCCPTRGKIAIK